MPMSWGELLKNRPPTREHMFYRQRVVLAWVWAVGCGVRASLGRWMRETRIPFC
jgi:hypothetical protein